LNAAAREAFKQRWSPNTIKQVREHLQWLVENEGPPLLSAYRAPFCGILPQICKENMACKLAKRRAAKFGIGTSDLLPTSTPLAWVHQSDPDFMVDVESGFTDDAPSACRHRAASIVAPPKTAHAVAPPEIHALPHPSDSQEPHRIARPRLADCTILPNSIDEVGGSMPNLAWTGRPPTPMPSTNLEAAEFP
jgi:hypothetical protein